MPRHAERVGTVCPTVRSMADIDAVGPVRGEQRPAFRVRYGHGDAPIAMRGDAVVSRPVGNDLPNCDPRTGRSDRRVSYDGSSGFAVRH